MEHLALLMLGTVLAVPFVAYSVCIFGHFIVQKGLKVVGPWLKKWQPWLETHPEFVRVAILFLMFVAGVGILSYARFTFILPP